MLAQADFSKTVLRIAHVAKPKTALERKVELVVNLIKVRIKEMSVEDAAESLRLHVLDLRQSMIEFFAQKDLKTAQYSEGIDSYKAEAPTSSQFNALKEEVDEVLTAQNTIFTAIAEKAGFERFGQATSDVPDLITLQNSSPEAVQYWIEKSIDVEFSLITADMVMSGELSLTKKKIKELITFMDRAISDYGGFSILFKLWEPTYQEIDNSRLIMNMHIMAAVYNSKYGTKPATKMSVEETKAYLLSGVC